MSKVRVCFLGTTDFSVACLKALLEDEHFQVVGVVTQPDRPAGRKLQLTPSPVKQFALSKGLKVLTPESLKKNNLIVAEIDKWSAEVAVVVAFGQILEESFINSFHFGAVNVHASLLPKWRGAAPIQRAIENGDVETGVSLQKMVKKLDAGDVIGERKIKITEEMNSLELHDQLAFLGADLLRVELMDYIRGNLAPHPQDENLVTYAKKIDKAESLLDWNLDSTHLHNKIRAFVWGPGTYTFFEGKRLKIHKSAVLQERNRDKTGRFGLSGEVGLSDFVNRLGHLVHVTERGVVILCKGNTFLEVLEVQPESRSKISALEWYKSLPRKETVVLG